MPSFAMTKRQFPRTYCQYCKKSASSYLEKYFQKVLLRSWRLALVDSTVKYGTINCSGKMDSKLAGDVCFQNNNACDSLYGQKHDQKYALYKVTCYTHTHTPLPIRCCFELC